MFIVNVPELTCLVTESNHPDLWETLTIYEYERPLSHRRPR